VAKEETHPKVAHNENTWKFCLSYKIKKSKLVPWWDANSTGNCFTNWSRSSALL